MQHSIFFINSPMYYSVGLYNKEAHKYSQQYFNSMQLYCIICLLYSNYLDNKKKKRVHMNMRNMVRLKNSNYIECEIYKGDIIHITGHISFFIIEIEKITKLTSKRIINPALLIEMYNSFYFNCISEIASSLKNLAPEYRQTVDDFAKELSIICNSKNPDSDIVRLLLERIREYLLSICKLFGDYNHLENAIKNYRTMFENNDW